MNRRCDNDFIGLWNKMRRQSPFVGFLSVPRGCNLHHHLPCMLRTYQVTKNKKKIKWLCATCRAPTICCDYVGIFVFAFWLKLCVCRHSNRCCRWCWRTRRGANMNIDAPARWVCTYAPHAFTSRQRHRHTGNYRVCVTSRANTVHDSDGETREGKRQIDGTGCTLNPMQATHPPIPGVCHRRYRHHRSRRRRQYGLTIARETLAVRVSVCSMCMAGWARGARVSFFASFMMEKCHLFISENLHSKFFYVKICHVTEKWEFRKRLGAAAAVSVLRLLLENYNFKSA